MVGGQFHILAALPTPGKEPQSLCGCSGDEKNVLLLLGFKPRTFWSTESCPQAIAVKFRVQQTGHTAI